MKLLVTCGVLLGLVGCAGGPTLLIDNRAASLASPVVETVLVATNRAPSDDPQLVYSGRRGGAVRFASVEISIPPDREPGEISYPKGRADLRTDFVARSIDTDVSERDFFARVDRQSLNPETGRRSVVVFVHGYNTDFSEGVFFNAQMAHDYQSPSLPVSFSWASAGDTRGYLYDRESAQIARSDLADLLRRLARGRVDDILLVAHSMGSVVTMEAMRDLSLGGEDGVLSRIEGIVLASPDLDVDVFERQVQSLRRVPELFVVFASQRDPALGISSRLRGGAARVGDGSSAERLAALGVTVIDLTDVSGRRRNEHSKFASSPLVINMIRQADAVRNSLDGSQQPDLLVILEDSIGDVASSPVRIINQARSNP